VRVDELANAHNCHVHLSDGRGGLLNISAMELTSKASDPAPVSHRTPPTEEAKQPQSPQPTQTIPQDTPTFLYSCDCISNWLHRINLLTGGLSKFKVPGYQFTDGCRWCELPGGSLLITGGGGVPAVRDVVKIDPLREYAAFSLPSMHTARRCHSPVYHSQYVYVLGGESSYKGLSECERYVCAESRWEVLAAMPVACWSMSAIELHNSLYALGGYNGSYLDTVQKFSLESLTWQLMQLKLPLATSVFPCFKKSTEVYLVIDKTQTLYSFTPLEVKPIKTFPDLYSCFSYTSYYSRGTLYYEHGSGFKLTRL
jgi:hypothetical protein